MSDKKGFTELARLLSMKKEIQRQTDFFKKNNIKDFSDSGFSKFISKSARNKITDNKGYIDFENILNRDDGL
jgi:hypothetical protein